MHAGDGAGPAVTVSGDALLACLEGCLGGGYDDRLVAHLQLFASAFEKDCPGDEGHGDGGRGDDASDESARKAGAVGDEGASVGGTPQLSAVGLHTWEECQVSGRSAR